MNESPVVGERPHLIRPPLRRMLLLASVALLLPLPGCGILGLGDDDGSREPEPGQATVLFIGSSYLNFNNVPTRFQEFARRGGHDVFVRSYLFNGRRLSSFAASTGTKTVLRERDWDYVVLQGSGQNVAYPEMSEDAPYFALKELHRIATEDSPETRVVYMMPWAFEDGMLWIEGRTETYEDMQLDIRERVLEWASKLDLVIAPVGMAFYEVMTTWNPEVHFLFEADWNHASEEGSYLTAATFFSTIFAESVTDVGYNWRLGAEVARDLREVATTTVLENLALWRIPTGGGS